MADIERSIEVEQIDYNIDINNVSYSIDILPQNTYTIELNKQGPRGIRGYTGNGIESYVKTSSSGLIDTYTITFTDGETTTVDVTNGKDGEDGEAATISVGTVTTGLPTDPASVTNVGTSLNAIFDFTIPKGDKGDTGDTGATGNGVSGVSLLSTVGLVNTYRMSFTNGTYFDYPVTNGQDGTGSVDSVNGQTGNVVLTAPDVGALSDTTVIPTDTSDLTNGAGYITSADLPTNYVTTNTAQDISGRKTFLGEKAIYFKQSSATNKLGFTLYNTSNTEVGGLEYRPNTISTSALLALNCSQTSTNYVGFRYWGTPAVNVLAPKPTTAGNYYIPVNITDGATTVTASSNGTLNISTLLPDVSNLANKDLSNLSSTGRKVIDGQWVKSTSVIQSETASVTTGSVNYDLSTYLPNDGYNYEIIIAGRIFTGNTSGDTNYLRIGSALMETTYICAARTRASSNTVSAYCIVIPIGTNRVLTVEGFSNNTGTYNISALAYRRIGTNS